MLQQLELSVSASSNKAPGSRCCLSPAAPSCPPSHGSTRARSTAPAAAGGLPCTVSTPVMLAARSAGNSTAAAKQRPYGFEVQTSLMASLSWKPSPVFHSSPLASSTDQVSFLCSGLSPAEHSVGRRTEGPLLLGQLGEEVPEPDSFLLLSSAAGCGASSSWAAWHTQSTLGSGYKGGWMSSGVCFPSTRSTREQLLRVHLSTLP